MDKIWLQILGIVQDDFKFLIWMIKLMVMLLIKIGRIRREIGGNGEWEDR